MGSDKYGRIKINGLVEDHQILHYLRWLAEPNQYGSKKSLANAIGITPQKLSDILADRRKINQPVLDFLGLERVIYYRVKKEEPKNE